MTGVTVADAAAGDTAASCGCRERGIVTLAMHESWHDPVSGAGRRPGDLIRLRAAEAGGVPFLMLRDGDDAQQVHPLAGDRLVIGRAETNDVVISLITACPPSCPVLKLRNHLAMSPGVVLIPPAPCDAWRSRTSRNPPSPAMYPIDRPGMIWPGSARTHVFVMPNGRKTSSRIHSANGRPVTRSTTMLARLNAELL